MRARARWQLWARIRARSGGWAGGGLCRPRAGLCAKHAGQCRQWRPCLGGQQWPSERREGEGDTRALLRGHHGLHVMTGLVTVSWGRDVMTLWCITLWHNRMKRETYLCIVVLWSLTHAHSVNNLFSSSWWIQNTDNKAYHLASLRFRILLCCGNRCCIFEFADNPLANQQDLMGVKPSGSGHNTSDTEWREHAVCVTESRSVTAKKVFSQTKQLIRLCCSSVWKNAGK